MVLEPLSRCAVRLEGCIYEYLFSEDLYKGWSWSEKFPGQPEIERWLNWVADKLDLRRDIQFETRIKSARFDEASGHWILTTDSGQKIDTQFLVTCCGMLSAPLTDQFPGQDSFKGKLDHTSMYPKDAVDLSGKCVGVVGRSDRHPGDPDGRQPGRPPDGCSSARRNTCCR